MHTDNWIFDKSQTDFDTGNSVVKAQSIQQIVLEQLIIHNKNLTLTHTSHHTQKLI